MFVSFSGSYVGCCLSQETWLKSENLKIDGIFLIRDFFPKFFVHNPHGCSIYGCSAAVD